MDKKDLLYIFGTVILFATMGLYLAFSQGGSFNSILTIPGRGKAATTPVVTPSVTPQEAFLQDTPAALDSGSNYIAILESNLGIIELDLFETQAPNSVKSFIHLAQNRYYEGTDFHRYIPGAFIQGGSRNTINSDPLDDKLGGPGYITPDEINWDSLNLNEERRNQLTTLGYTTNTEVNSVKMEKYSVAFASSAPNTNGSQFFIVIADNGSSILTQLEGIHTVFGKVVKGQEIIDGLSSLTVNLDNLDYPQLPIEFEIKKISIEVR